MNTKISDARVAAAQERIAEYHPQPAALNEVSGNSGELGGDERARFESYRGGDFERDAQGYYVNCRTAQDWAMWQAALAATGKQQESK